MGWFDGFPFKSREQVEKERKIFVNKIFPLGLEQREKALAVLKEVTGPKLSANEVLFAFICAKEAYLNEEEEEKRVQAALHAMQRQRELRQQDKAAIVALLELELGIDSLESYPTAGQVKQQMPE